MLFENIKKGDIVCLIGVNGPMSATYEGYLSGEPFLVDALNYPFIVTRPSTDESRLAVFDIRAHVLTKASRSYYNTFINNQMIRDSRLISECPVCAEGTFRLIHDSSDRPYFRCNVCKSTVKEGQNVR